MIRPTVSHSRYCCCGSDIQAMPPVDWCEKCGREIYAEGHALCPDCEAEINEEEDE